MTKIRTLFAQSALAAIFTIGAVGAAHADIATYSASISAPSSNGPTAGNTSSSDGQNTTTSSTDNGGNYPSGPSVFTYDTQLPNKPRLPKLPLIPKKPCRGAVCKVQTASVDGKICFYTGANFTGAHFCATIGTNAPYLSARWNDRIASVEVIGPVSTKVCSDRGYSGQCLVIDTSHNKLFTLNGEISSYTVRR